MTDLKVACWNIYFSHNLVTGENSPPQINPTEADRAARVGLIVNDIDADLIGIVESMPKKKLRFFRDKFFPQYELLVEGNGKKLNLALLYKPSRVEVELLPFPRGKWQAQIGYQGVLEDFRFSRIPLVAGVRDPATNERFALAIVHMKSKKTYTSNKSEPFRNRKKIVAQSQRTREIMAELVNIESDYKRFIVMGDVNDGPGFDEYEAKIVVSGIETLLGSVFDPKGIYVSFSDLASGGIPTTPFPGAPQLDHILNSQAMDRPHGARIVEGSGKVRSDLVDFNNGSGKDTDSDHSPVEVMVST